MKNKITFNLVLFMLFASSFTNNNLLAQTEVVTSSNNIYSTSQNSYQQNIILKSAKHCFFYSVFMENLSYRYKLKDKYPYNSNYINNTILNHNTTY